MGQAAGACRRTLSDVSVSGANFSNDSIGLKGSMTGGYIALMPSEIPNVRKDKPSSGLVSIPCSNDAMDTRVGTSRGGIKVGHWKLETEARERTVNG